MDTFHEYSSIENSYRTKTVNMIVDMGLSQVLTEWVVTCKIHGSNFSFWYDGTTHRNGKRTSLIAEGDNFYNCQQVIEDNQDKITQMYNVLNLTKDTDTLTVFGELFGGTYPHPDVKRNTAATAVQKGIYYSPDNLFYAFDIKVNGVYVDYDKCVEIFEKVNLFHAKILFKGSLKDALAYPNEFESTIPALLGLPPIPNNICEGVIVKPVINKYFNDGSRVILKNKNDKWKERASASKNPKAPKEAEEPLMDDAQKLKDEMMSLVCENRLHNVISKIGQVTNKDFGKILGEFMKDVIKDFEKDNHEEFLKIDESIQKQIRKSVMTKSSTLIRSQFIDILDQKI